MSKHRLPLDSLKWTPLIEVHRFVCEQTGDRRLAAQDLTDAMANGRVRSMRRRVRRVYDEPERELLQASFWATEYLLDGSMAELQLTRRGRRPPHNPVVPGPNFEPNRLSSSGYVFYASKSDCKNIFGLRVALQDTKESVHEKLEKPGRPQTIRRQELREEIVRRCWQKGRFIAPESHTILITDLRAWHKRKFKNEPNYDDLRKFVGDAIAILKLAGK
jgi:hypothetical protein